MRGYRVSKFLASVFLVVILAVTIAEEIAEDFTESREVRGPRCEHHNHDGKRPSKWLGKLKRTKTQYASSKPNSRPKSHYGQPHTHNRPPKPQYIPPTTHFRIPPYNPPTSYLVPHYSHPTVQNPNALQQAFYSPQQNPNSFSQSSYAPQRNPYSLPQSLNFYPPAGVSPAPTEAPSYAPSSYSKAPYSQSPEDFEDLSLPMPVYTPPAQVYNPPAQNYNPPVQVYNTPDSYAPPPAPVAVSYDSPVTSHTEAPTYVPPAYHPAAYTEVTTSPPSYTEAISPQIHSPAASAYDPPVASGEDIPYTPSSSQVPVYDPPTTYPPQPSTEYSVYSPPSYVDVTYPEPHSPPVPIKITPEPYNPPAFIENIDEAYAPLEQNNTPVPYPLPDPPSSDFASYYPSASTGAPYYPPVPTEAPYYPPESNEAPYDFPPSYNDASYPEPYDPPTLMYNAPAPHSSTNFPSYNFPSYSPPSFVESADHSPSGYKEAVYPSPNHRTSAYKPSHENEEFFQQSSFPRFNEFLQQMLRGKI